MYKVDSGCALFQDALYIVELHYTKVHGAYFIVQMQNTKVHYA